MRLRELEPQFVKLEFKVETWKRAIGPDWKADGPTEEVTGPREYHLPLPSVAGADGIFFLCPKCFMTNQGNVGTHGVLCWQPHVPLTVFPKPGRWAFQGSGYDDLTLVAGSSSILLTCNCKPKAGEPPCSCCKAHFFIRQGNIEW
jgi:hypothetical protein